MQRFKFIDFMVVELHFFKKKMKNMAKNVKALFKLVHTSYITTQIIFGLLVIFHTFYTLIKSEINLKLKVKMKYIWFSMGIYRPEQSL